MHDYQPPSEWAPSAAERSASAVAGLLGAGALVAALGWVVVALYLGPGPWLPDGGLPDLGPEEQSFEFVLLSTKLDQVEDAAASDVVVFGDSSGLFGFDPEAFSETSGLTAFNLATMGNAGIAGHEFLLRRMLEKGRPRAIVLWLHPRTLARSLENPQEYARWMEGRTDRARFLRWAERANLELGGRLRLLRSGGVQGLPRHDTSVSLRARLEQGHGHYAAEPASHEVHEEAPALAPEQLEELSGWVTVAVEAGVAVYLVVQPYASDGGVSEAAISAVRAELHDWLGDTVVAVQTVPLTMPGEGYESAAHLAAESAAWLSGRIGTELGEQIGRRE